MEYISTRSLNKVTIEEALLSGTANDGGLYLPNRIPKIDQNDFMKIDDYATFSTTMLSPYFYGSIFRESLERIVNQSFNFSVQIRNIDKIRHRFQCLSCIMAQLLLLKILAQDFLAACSAEIQRKKNDVKRTILVATSGDTGGAVASAFYKLEGFNVIVLFPNNRVSPRQEKQLTCWGNNVTSLAVKGEFDDCQRLVKEAFSHQSSMRINPCIC